MKNIRLLSMLLALSLLLGMWVVPAQAYVDSASGTCGENIRWNWKYSTRTLSIVGSGPMYDYTPDNQPGWSSYWRDIRQVNISLGVTRIGDYAFVDSDKVIINIPKTITELGHGSLSATYGYTVFYGEAPQMEEDTFAGNRATRYYFLDWDASSLQDYGGRGAWERAKLYQTDESKTLYQLNEPIKKENFVLMTKIVDQTRVYDPEFFQVGAYDNSTVGHKTVEITVDEQTITHEYYVTNGNSFLNDLRISPIPVYAYTGVSNITPKPTVSVGDYPLELDRHYTLSYKNNIDAGDNALVIITGKGDWKALYKEIPFSIVRQDLAQTEISYAASKPFIGEPVDLSVTIRLETPGLSVRLLPGKSYVLDGEGCINVGNGLRRAIGIGNMYGYKNTPLKVTQNASSFRLKGASNGLITGELNQDFYYEESIASPGKMTFSIDASGDMVVYYQLHKLVEEQPQLITVVETEYGTSAETKFEYDFSSVYEDAAQEGGAIYMLGYSWVNSQGYMYTGVRTLYIPAKVPDATSLVVEEMENTRDFRYIHLSAYGPDGNTGILEWSSSDPSVAEVSVGTVTLKKPGTVNITAKYKNLQASCQITAEQLYLKDANIAYYDSQTQKPQAVYENVLLKEGLDYSLATTISDDVVTVTITGQGLFTGQLVREFDLNSGNAIGHNHSFDHCEDGTCISCEYTRESAHKPAQQWRKNRQEHWHICQVCGEKTDVATHILSTEDETVCTVCGNLVILGDIDGSCEVNTEDVIALLLHVSMPSVFPISAEADFTADGAVTTEDVIQLLLHVSMPEMFPLG